jgi:tetratricopeptide (TPR) repeat protein
MGHTLLLTGEIAAAQAHYSQGFAPYEPAKHRPFATRFGQDISVSILGFRQLALWLLGYPDAALADADCAINDAREIGHAATLMYALNHAAMNAHIHCGNYKAAKAELEELVGLSNEKGAPFWKALATINKGLLLAVDGNPLDAIKMFTSGMAAYQSTGAFIIFGECIC